MTNRYFTESDIAEIVSRLETEFKGDVSFASKVMGLQESTLRIYAKSVGKSYSSNSTSGLQSQEQSSEKERIKQNEKELFKQILQRYDRTDSSSNSNTSRIKKADEIKHITKYDALKSNTYAQLDSSKGLDLIDDTSKKTIQGSDFLSKSKSGSKDALKKSTSISSYLQKLDTSDVYLRKKTKQELQSSIDSAIDFSKKYTSKTSFTPSFLFMLYLTQEGVPPDTISDIMGQTENMFIFTENAQKVKLRSALQTYAVGSPKELYQAVIKRV